MTVEAQQALKPKSLTRAERSAQAAEKRAKADNERAARARQHDAIVRTFEEAWRSAKRKDYSDATTKGEDALAAIKKLDGGADVDAQ